MSIVVLEPSERPGRLYHVRTFGEPTEQTWVEEKSTHVFHGGFEFEQLSLLRRRGKQKEQNHKYTVITILIVFREFFELHAFKKINHRSSHWTIKESWYATANNSKILSLLFKTSLFSNYLSYNGDFEQICW